MNKGYEITKEQDVDASTISRYWIFMQYHNYLDSSAKETGQLRELQISYRLSI